jgi:hypothetical protein
MHELLAIFDTVVYTANSIEDFKNDYCVIESSLDYEELRNSNEFEIVGAIDEGTVIIYSRIRKGGNL